MARTDVETLLVRLEASAAKFERDMNRARRVADTETKGIENRFAQTNRNVSRELSELAGKAAAIGITGATIAEIGKLADAWTNLGNKIAASGTPLAAIRETQAEIVQIANISRSSLDGVGTLYARLSRSAGELGASQSQVARATETVSKSFKLSGATTQEAQSAVIQLSQALQSGRLQGDELRSLLENAPVLTRAIAKEFGVGIGELKKLGEEGALVSSRVFKAILAASSEVDGSFSKTTATLADSFTIFRNKATEFVGTSVLVKNATGVLGSAIQGVGNNLDLLGAGAIALGAVLAGRLVAAGLFPATVAMGQTALATTAVAATMRAAATSSTLAGAAFTGTAVAATTLGRALALVGGPIGAAVLGTVGLMVFLGSQTKTTAESAKFYESALKTLSPAAAAADEAQRRLAEATNQAKDAFTQAAAAAADARKAIDQISQDQKTASDAADQLLAKLEAFANARGLPDVSEKAKTVVNDLRSGKISADEAKSALEAMAATDGRFARLLNALGAVVGRLGLVREAARQATAALLAAEGAGRRPADQTERETERAGAIFVAGQRKTAATPKAERAIQSRAQGLVTEAKAAGAVLELEQAVKLARELTALEEAADPKKSSGSRAAAKKDEYEKELEQLREKTALLVAEADAIGRGTFEVERSKAAKELELAAVKAKKELTPEVIADIDREASAYAAAKKAIEDKNAAMQASKSLQEFIGSNISSFFSDIVSGGKNASEALMNLTKRLADAALQAVILGQGPLAGLFGMSGPSGGVGGIIGALFSGVMGQRASGGPVSAGRPYIVGEKRPEVFVPTSSGRIMPKVPGGGSSYAPVYNIDARGADASAVARIERALDQRDRQFSQMTQSSNRLTQVRGMRP